MEEAFSNDSPFLENGIKTSSYLVLAKCLAQYTYYPMIQPINPNINCEVILDFFHSSKALSNVIFTMGKVNTNTIS